MIKLAIFDLGETLIFYKGLALDWSSHYGKALRSVFAELHITLNEKQITQASYTLYKYNTRINPRAEEVSADRIFAELLDAADISKTHLDNFINGFFKYFQRKTEPEETAFELLTFLKGKGINTAVLTDVPYGMPKKLVMEDLKSIKEYIDVVLTSVEVGYRKPSTNGLHLLLDKFNCKQTEAVYVGNEKKDVDTAVNTGVLPVLLNNDTAAPTWGQKQTISKLIELKKLLTG